jgi:PhzF family phenazine biosynthesis protein
MKIYQVDAFTPEKFKGNPACVCVLPDGFKADEAWMQNIASEMNLSETAFVQAQSDNTFLLRWFTPTTEVDLCGHATLATSHILWQEGLLDKKQPVLFDTRSGHLEVTLSDSWMCMNFPIDKLKACREPVGLEMALGCSILATYEAGQDLLIEVADEKTVAELVPSLQQLSMLPVRCCVVTSQGSSEEIDFVSRVFGPQVGIDEDPVTGSTHCSLTPFWAERLSKTKMTARQLSQRGGTLEVELLGDRVAISGQAVTVFKGELSV